MRYATCTDGARAIFNDKPHLFHGLTQNRDGTYSGLWICVGQNAVSGGPTLMGAYLSWLRQYRLSSAQRASFPAALRCYAR